MEILTFVEYLTSALKLTYALVPMVIQVARWRRRWKVSSAVRQKTRNQ